MAVIARDQVTVTDVTDVSAVYRYYLLQSSTLTSPDKPTTNPPGGSWSLTEPSYTAGSTNTLYFTDLTVFSNNTFSYSDVSVSSSYEAAKTAYNKAATAQDTANGKNAVFYQTSAPGTSGRKLYDIWFDTDADNKMYYWDGSAWTVKQFGTGAIASESITADLLAAESVTADKIVARSITAAKIAANTITANEIKANTITADRLSVTSLSAISANLGSITGGSINIGSGKFKVTASGVLTATGADITGKITASTGKIGPWTLDGSALESDYFKLWEGGMTEGTYMYLVNRIDTNAATRFYPGTLSMGSLSSESNQAYMSLYKSGSNYYGYVYVSNTADNTKSVSIDGSTGTVYAETICEGGPSLSSKYAPISHTHDYLPLTGGTVTGNIYVQKYAESGDTGLYANNSYKGIYSGVQVSAYGNHGLTSSGYKNTGDWQWIIYRNYDNGHICTNNELYTHNEGYTSLRPVVGTNAGTNAVGVIVANSATFGIYGRWSGGATANMSGRTISCPSSDIRLKENITDSEVDALSVINSIRMRQFDWKDKSRGHWDCGFVVDEMERDIDPNFRIGGEDDEQNGVSYKSVDTFYLQGYEVKAIQELCAQVQQLKEQIRKLQADK